MSDLEQKLERRKDRRTVIIKLGILLVLLGSLGAVGIIALDSSRRASRERNASTSLKTLASSEADFRANDRDWNHVNDFWTADVKSLTTLTTGAVVGTNDPKDPPIRLIESAVARADGDGTFFPAGGENLPLTVGSKPDGGYWYLTLLTDSTLGKILEATYAQDTGGNPSMGSVHNTSKFGFVAFPESDGQGKFVFIVNENNTIFRQALTTNARMGTSLPPGRKGLSDVFQHWPDDSKPAPALFYCPQ